MKDLLSGPHLFETVMETIAALVVVFDAEGQVVLFNRACEALTGYGAEEIKGKKIWEILIPREERAEVERVFLELVAGDFPMHFENAWMTRDGERRRIGWSNSALLGEDGAVRYVIGTGLDVTEQREAEAQARSEAMRRAAELARESSRVSESIFTGIVDLSADGIISVDSAQRIRLFNQGAVEIFGYETMEILGESLERLLPEFARRGHSEHVLGFQQTEKPSRRMGERGQIYGRRKNGEVFPAEASISKQKVDGEWVFTAVIRDVTEQRRAEEELERRNEELRRSNEDLEHFASVASHDLQEPLRKIQAFGERLESRYGDGLPERGQDYLRRMQNAAGRMSTLIQDLLAFSRVTTRAQPFERIDLDEVVARVLSDLEVQIERSEGQVVVGELGRIDADPLQMRLLFQNLISNALKFRRAEEAPRVVVEGMRDGEQIELRVRDNGVGFEEKYLDRIFDVFQRLHGRGTYEGTGMGLAIARKIVERHGGEITARSVPGEGATFVIILPIEQPEEEER